jgi:DNA-binding transcriptional LysR family regulator
LGRTSHSQPKIGRSKIVNCITYEGFLAPNTWSFAQNESDIVIAVKTRLLVSNVEAACDADRAGVGLTRAFSYHIAAAVVAGTLTTVLDDYQPAALPVSAFYGASYFVPIKLRVFLDFAGPRLRARLAP